MSEAWKSGITYSSLTDVGMRRANNQDACASLPADSEERFLHRGHLFVVADGMGAHAAGELASRIAAERIATEYFRSQAEESAEALRTAVRDANAEIHRRGQSNPEFHNMGTTASALAILPSGAWVAHVGDSRVYRLRDGCLEQLTFDHSLVWEMEASGQIHPDSSLGQSIPKNVITRSLGPNAEVAVDIEGPLPIKVGDVFVLCSDGLTGPVGDSEIGALVDCLSEEKATRVLVDLANLRGGADNSTVIVVRAHESSRPGSDKPKNRRKPKTAVSPMLLGAAGACVLGAIILGVVGMTGPMVIAIILGMVAAAVAGFQFWNERPKHPPHPCPSPTGGKAPYRRYNAEATTELHSKLKETVDALREAATEREWEIDWSTIDEHQHSADQSLGRGEPRDAVRQQSEAIIETMKQLREQHNRMAGETAIDY